MNHFQEFRQTRSKKVFSPWSGNFVVPALDFDAQAALATAVDRFISDELGDSPLSTPPSTPPPQYTIFSTSPLSSAPSSPPTTFTPLPNIPLPEADNLTLTMQSSTQSSTHLTTPSKASKAKNTLKNGKKRSKRTKAFSHTRRSLKKMEKMSKQGHKPYDDRPKIQEKYFKTYATPEHSIQVSFDAIHSAAASTGFVGLRRSFSKQTFTLEEIVKLTKFQVIPWDGCKPTPIVDSCGRILAHLAGHPDSEDWADTCQEAAGLMDDARAQLGLSDEADPQRRGSYHSITFGVSHGGGQRCPGMLKLDVHHQRVVGMLNQSRPFRRMANLASSMVKTWAPGLFDYMTDRLGQLFDKHQFEKIFSGSIYPAATYNMGPKTATFLHTDAANLPFGLCTVTAFGNYNPKRSGHLILWDLGLIVEFPPGSTILLPSAIIAHGNVAVGEGETRYSFTQWAAGGLFRWVEQGFQRSEDFLASLKPEEYQEWVETIL
ncbi:hypothetical protein H0H93_011464 [Arthromyces matolae]|nr:hypothetical protein H0H93_011464 [Arthromyces matolae]